MGSSLLSTSSGKQRALSLYRSLLRAARSLPSQQDRKSLEEETKQRFRVEREKGKSSGESDGSEKGEREGKSEILASRLFDEAEARLHDARHHGIPFARLEHAPQIPRAVLESARRLFRNEGKEDGGVNLPRNASARAKLEAAVERRRIKRLEEEEEQRRRNE